MALFSRQNTSHFTWQGGGFVGHVAVPAREQNGWYPNANAKGIEITTTRTGGTHGFFFREIRSNGIVGAVIDVHGLPDPKNESAVLAHAERVALENCTLLCSGKFMWDYGYLWQVVTYPEFFRPWEVERALRQFRSDLPIDATPLANEDKVRIHNTPQVLNRVESDAPKEAFTFLGNDLPPEITRGRQYFVIEAAPDFIRIATEPRGPPIRFSRAGTCKIARDVFSHYRSAGNGPRAPWGGDLASPSDLRNRESPIPPSEFA